MSKRQFFGTDGIRGTVGVHPITPDFVLRLGHAVGQVLKKAQAGSTVKPVVVIGKDTRISGYMLESALESGFNSAGVDVILLGPLPTPGVAYLTRALRASLGVVISASHNAYPDNGIKFFSSQGTKLDDAWELAVEAAMADKPQWASSDEMGRAKRLDDAAGRYLEFCKSTFDSHLNLRGMKIVVDAAHGAAYQVAPKVFHELGAEVIAIGCAPDGVNINEGVGATHPEALIAAVKAHGAHYGIALDGDADRLQMVDHTGRLFNGDELVYLLALDRLKCGEKIEGVAGTLMTNMAIELGLKHLGIEFVRANVGDKYVLEALSSKGWVIGGESSGHILALDKHSTGDGLISALQVLQAVNRLQKTMAQALADVTLFPQVMLNVKVPVGTDWKTNQALQKGILEVEAELGTTGRVLIRASGTEPVVRVMVEAAKAQQARALAEKLAATL
ncbi:MAG: phosphoglucosamine mutase [Cytophagales bacterium]|nr:phosphoglucosamine mutase [Cytophagales bacterium]